MLASYVDIDWSDTLALIGLKQWNESAPVLRAFLSPVLVSLVMIMQHCLSNVSGESAKLTKTQQQLLKPVCNLLIAVAAFGRPSVCSAGFGVLSLTSLVLWSLNKPIDKYYWMLSLVYATLFVTAQFVFQMGQQSHGWSLNSEQRQWTGLLAYSSDGSMDVSSWIGLVAAAATQLTSSLVLSGYRRNNASSSLDTSTDGAQLEPTTGWQAEGEPILSVRSGDTYGSVPSMGNTGTGTGMAAGLFDGGAESGSRTEGTAAHEPYASLEPSSPVPDSEPRPTGDSPPASPQHTTRKSTSLLQLPESLVKTLCVEYLPWTGALVRASSLLRLCCCCCCC